MKDPKPPGWMVRLLWPALGGAWGAWVGFGPVLRYLPITNHDTFAPFGLILFGLIFAMVGLLIGAYSAMLIGAAAERLLRFLGAGAVPALVMASALNGLAIWQMTAIFQANSTPTRPSGTVKPRRSTTPLTPTPAEQGSFKNACSDPRPADAWEGALWDTECK